MGCFLACFGLSKKRKRPKTLYRVLAAHHQKHGNYEALDSSVSSNLAITDSHIVPFSHFRNKCKEQTKVKTRKKVSFNLNVQMYEPDPTAYQILDSNEEEENEKDSEAVEERSSLSSSLGEKSEALEMKYPLNYRYYNCRDGYDEEDGIAYEESDIDEYDDYDDDEFDYENDWDYDGYEDHEEIRVYDQNTRQKELSNQFDSSVAEDSIKNEMPLASNDRIQYIHSVLSPVENLSQWKTIKAKVPSCKHRRKENIPLERETSMPSLSEPNLNLSPLSFEANVHQSKPFLPEIAVDASLSNRLISPDSNLSRTTIHCQWGHENEEQRFSGVN